MKSILRTMVQVSALAALAGLANTASAAFSDCSTSLPEDKPTGTTFPKSGCGVTSSHRGNASATPANRNVVVSMNSNTSGSGRRVLTMGLNGVSPISSLCIAERRTVGSDQTSANECSAKVLNNIRMFIQLGS
jgi:hypothetical protein